MGSPSHLGSEGAGDADPLPFFMPPELAPERGKSLTMITELLHITQNVFRTGLMPAIRAFHARHSMYSRLMDVSQSAREQHGFSSLEEVRTEMCLHSDVWGAVIYDPEVVQTATEFVAFQASWLLRYLETLVSPGSLGDPVAAAAVHGGAAAKGGAAAADPTVGLSLSSRARSSSLSQHPGAEQHASLAEAAAAAGVKVEEVQRVLHLFPSDAVIEMATWVSFVAANLHRFSEILLLSFPPVVDLFATLLAVPEIRCNAHLTASVVLVRVGVQRCAWCWSPSLTRACCRHAGSAVAGVVPAAVGEDDA